MQSIKLNLIPGAVLPVVNVSQYDVNRTFALAVYDGAASYDLTGKSVTIRGTKSDNHGFDYGTSDGVVSVSGNTVTISTTQQMTAVGGQVMAELRIESGTTVIGTLNFIIDVEPSALSDDTIISDTEIPVIERDFEAALAEAEADALKAEGYAVGTQDGTPATSGQPYYHDNAKYYKEQAEAAGSGTSANALKAEGYAVGTQNGTPVSSGSPYYHNNAAYYDGTAQTSATNAGNSESAAAGSASAAAADALEAEGFAVGEQNGVPVSSGSPYYQNNARYYSGLSNPTALANMSDVDISSPSNNQVLKYNSTSQKWENGTGGGGASALDDLTDVTITTPASGDGLLYDGAEWVNGAVATPTQLAAKLGIADAQVLGAWNLAAGKFTTSVLSGITFTVADDNSVKLTGHSTLIDIGVHLYSTHWILPKGSYYFASITILDDITFLLRNASNSVVARIDPGSKETAFTLSADTDVYMDISAGFTKNPFNDTIYPTIALKPNQPYVPWVMTNKELTDIVDINTGITFPAQTAYELASTKYIYTCGKLVNVAIDIKSLTIESYPGGQTWTLIGQGFPKPYKNIVQNVPAPFENGKILQVYLDTNGTLYARGGSINNNWYSIVCLYIKL